VDAGVQISNVKSMSSTNTGRRIAVQHADVRLSEICL